MKRCDVDFREDIPQKQLERAWLATAANNPLFKNTTKFIRKFKMSICNLGVVDWEYKLLKNDFERLYPNLNFEEEWQKIIEQ